MEKSVLEKRIIEKAKNRFDQDVESAREVLAKHPILNALWIHIKDNVKLKLCAVHGYCPATDLFTYSHDRKLLCENTNFYEIKSKLMEKYIEEETDKILNQLSILQDYIINESE